jgi:hypothetical protein
MSPKGILIAFKHSIGQTIFCALPESQCFNNAFNHIFLYMQLLARISKSTRNRNRTMRN